MVTGLLGQYTETSLILSSFLKLSLFEADLVQAYIDRVRAKMVKQYLQVFEQLEITETEAFMESSYFRREQPGLPMGSDDKFEEDFEGMEDDMEEVEET
jgi:hypothetical protein